MKLRAAADARHEARTSFLTSRLKEGRHSDTDPGFRDGYSERPAPDLLTRSVADAYNAWQASGQSLVLLVFVGVPVLAIIPIAFGLAKARWKLDVDSQTRRGDRS